MEDSQSRPTRPGAAHRIGIYGGSFDPPHVGHVLAVSYVLSVGLVDDVIVVPVFEHAFDKDLTPFEQRLALCRAAFANQSQVEVSDLERGLPRPSYTLRTLQALAELHPDASFRLLVGADVAKEITKWHRFEEVCLLAQPLVLGRVGEFETGAPPAVLPGVSSTEVRRLLLGPQGPDTQAALALTVPARVLAEIRARGLYRPA